MEADRWRRVSDLFLAAQEVPAPERTGYLGEVCSDEDLRREVELLLEAQSQAKDFLTTPALEIAARMMD